MGAEPLHRTADAFLVRGRGVGASHQLPIEGSIEQDRVVEQIRHLIRGTDEAVKQPGEPEGAARSEEHTSELQSRLHLVCRLLLEKKKTRRPSPRTQTLA